MKIALDTNVLAYAEGVNGKPVSDATISLLERLSEHDIFLPAQAVGELFVVLYRKAKRSAPQAKSAVLAWTDAYHLIETSREIVVSAVDLVEEHTLSFWDAVIVSAAAHAQCRLLLSEDMQDGFTWRGTTVVNPYSKRPHALIRPYIE